MKVLRFEGTLQFNKVSGLHQNTSMTNQDKPFASKRFYETDSVNDALLTDSIDDPILPQLARKFKQAYNILFPAKVVSEAKNIKNQIDEIVDSPKFQAVA